MNESVELRHLTGGPDPLSERTAIWTEIAVVQEKLLCGAEKSFPDFWPFHMRLLHSLAAVLALSHKAPHSDGVKSPGGMALVESGDDQASLGKRYLYLSVSGTADDRFDPADISRATGIDASRSWRMGDSSRNGRQRSEDYWMIKSPAGREASLKTQAAALNELLDREAFCAALKSHRPLVNYVIETSTKGTVFELNRAFVRNLAALEAEIDFDLYWSCDARVVAGRCTCCRLSVPAPIEDLLPYIGGELRAAEVQVKLRMNRVAKSDAVSAFELDPEDNVRRLGDDDVEAIYIDELQCLQFSSDLLPCSGYSEHLEPEETLSKFVQLVSRRILKLGWTDRSPELLLRFIERGDFQGTAGIHFDAPLLEVLASLHSSITVQLTYLPEPCVRAAGTCWHCNNNVVQGF